ncbi:SUF system Fe-S cluster assembly regulator [Azoarcus sp. DD4]|uniref:SUF system Fe-S cluster assembly regulator n=1 Tax=Azoarcus sp. DD4 TaxID=2027405 RepID=UPI00112E3646|nr:SUF system Fe-S cluster assembly regulator [Azoarcus sp. DD4]QDF98107.1 SUF system Fe-S cluster assembly regulator [Azoarcus sp. DD4]
MLRISKLTDYGTLVMAQMASAPDHVFSAAGLADTLGLAPPTVSKVLKSLARHALVKSVRGARGGYALARPPADIALASIIDALEEQPFGLTECSAVAGLCGIEADCRVRANWLRINAVVRHALEDVRLTSMAPPLSAADTPRHPAAVPLVRMPAGAPHAQETDR